MAARILRTQRPGMVQTLVSGCFCVKLSQLSYNHTDIRALTRFSRALIIMINFQNEVTISFFLPVRHFVTFKAKKVGGLWLKYYRFVMNILQANSWINMT